MDALLTSFVAALAPPLAEACRGREGELSAQLAGLCDEARAAHPAVSMPPETLAAALARRVSPDEGLTQLAHVRAADVYLAIAAVAGDTVAITRIDALLSAEVVAGAASVRADGTILDEVKQRLRAHLLVGDEDRGAGLADFAGRGDLRGFLRVCAVRECLRLMKRQRREVGLDEQALDQIAPALDPELERLKVTYRQEFTASFVEALARLTPRERTLLKHQVVDRLSIDQIGALYAVHRATAARWLERARGRVAELTEALLGERLSLGAAEVASVIRLVRSQLDVTVERLLR